MLFMKRRLGISLLLLCLTLVSNASIFSQRTRPTAPPMRVVGTVAVAAATATPPLTAAQQRRQDAFIRVWTILDETYFDKTFNGLDWAKIRAEYQPKITAAVTNAEAHRLMQDMVL